MSKSNKTQISISNINDQATIDDLLGFDPYVKAVAKFLTNPRTTPPLTMSIEGSWGSGKSSFILQLKHMIEEKGGKTVMFNAWRYDKAEALWAAFALEFIHQLPKQFKRRRRLIGALKLLYLRFSWRNGWLDILRFISIILFFFSSIAISYFLLNDINLVDFLSQKMFKFFELTDDEKIKSSINFLIGTAGIAASLGILLSFVINLKNFVGNPLDIDLNKCLVSPNYGKHTDFIREFHNDFFKIVSAYAGTSKVYVFIDDLDRCEVPKAAELMQAINLLIANDPNLIFIIGMDRMKVAAGLAIKNEILLPYLYSLNTSEYFKNDKNQMGLEYGYEFIEKFIQLPFSVPQPEKENIRTLINKSYKDPPKTNQKIYIQRIKTKLIHLNVKIKSIVTSTDKSDSILYTNNQKDDSDNLDNQINKEIEMRIEGEKVEIGDDGENFKEITLMASDALDNNPRRLKQFINLFRLKLFIAKETGLFYYHEKSSTEERWNSWKLGKFVAISVRWPLLVSDLVSNRMLLSELQKIALNHSSSERIINSNLRLNYWSSQQNLMDILKYGCFDEKNSLNSKNVEKYSLENLNFDSLLKISPIILPQSKNNLYISNNSEIHTTINAENDVASLIISLEDANVNVRKMAASALREIKSNESVYPLIIALQDQNTGVRKMAASALGEIKSNKAVNPLIIALQDENAGVRKMVTFALGKIKSKEAVNPLIITLQDQNADVRRMAVSALGEIKSKEAVKPLIIALQDENAGVRKIAASALGEIKSKEAVNPLIITLQDQNADVRRMAVSALGEIKSNKAVNPLIIALQDENAGVRKMVASALDKIDSNEYAKYVAIEEAALEFIRKHKEGVFQSHLWKELNINSRECSRIITKLVRDEIIIRESAVHDGARTYLLKVANEGELLK